jgi:hypothetical protein
MTHFLLFTLSGLATALVWGYIQGIVCWLFMDPSDDVPTPESLIGILLVVFCGTCILATVLDLLARSWRSGVGMWWPYYGMSLILLVLETTLARWGLAVSYAPPLLNAAPWLTALAYAYALIAGWFLIR